MKANAWPFLVSRNRLLDYRVVEAPDFLVEAQIAKRLIKYVDANSKDSPTYCEVRDPEVGNITVVYHVVPAINGGQKFEDHVGRQILWIEGVVLKGTGITVLNADVVLSEAHEHVFETYRKFWHNAADATIKNSEPFTAEIQQETLPLLPPPPPRLQPLLLGLIMFLLIGVAVSFAPRAFLDKTAPDISGLKDPSGKTYSLTDFRSKCVLLIMGNSGKRDEVDGWARAFEQKYGRDDRIQAFVILDDGGSTGKSVESKNNSVRVLLDPGGKVHRDYGARKGQPNLFLIGPKGNIMPEEKDKNQTPPDFVETLGQVVDKCLYPRTNP